MARKRQTITARRKENLLRQVRRMEKRGYLFNMDIREVIKGLSPQKTRFFTTENLYRMSVVPSEWGEAIPGTEFRRQERQEAARKAAETRRRKKKEKPFEYKLPDEEPYEITQDVIDNFGELVKFFSAPVAETAKTLAGKEFPKPVDLANYGKSVKDFVYSIFREEISRDREALASRIYGASEEIDSLIGAIEYSAYKETIRAAGNEMIKIIRGTEHLSRSDRQRSEEVANNESWEDV